MYEGSNSTDNLKYFYRWTLSYSGLRHWGDWKGLITIIFSRKCWRDNYIVSPSKRINHSTWVFNHVHGLTLMVNYLADIPWPVIQSKPWNMLLKASIFNNIYRPPLTYINWSSRTIPPSLHTTHDLIDYTALERVFQFPYDWFVTKKSVCWVPNGETLGLLSSSIYLFIYLPQIRCCYISSLISGNTILSRKSQR